MREDVLDGSPEEVCPSLAPRGAGDGLVGIVVIGRNEGQRLARCLDSVLRTDLPAVYVDSGSSDRSPELAKARSIPTAVLTPDRPYTAARARNAGREELRAILPEAEYVQFVDGDCVLLGGWVRQAVGFLDQHPEYVAVAGRLHEREPGASLYNRLCQMEWAVPSGEASECGGNAMMRCRAFDNVGGFADEITAGEEPELCARLRAQGGRIMRLAVDMAEHDASMTRFSQWWRRSVRSGHASMQHLSQKGLDGRSHGRQVATRAILWAVIAPGVAVGAAVVTWASGKIHLAYASLIALLSIWIIKTLKVAVRRRRSGGTLADAGLYALFNWLAKFAEALGVLHYLANRLRGRRPGAVEYKGKRANA